MRRSVILGFVVVALIAFVLWAIGYFVQPILPKEINTHAILFLAILTSTIAAIGGFKDIVELLTLLRTKTVDSGDDPVQHNLPQPDFERFIGRNRELEEIHRLLAPKTRHFVITIDGVGGVGKTALALQVASSYVRTPQLHPRSHRFSAVIWITAKKDALSAEGIVPRHQRLHVLEDIFATVATVLNRRDVVSTPTDHQDEMVRYALTKHRTLVVIDNLETVDDDRIMSFVKEVPAPTKVIVTTRHRIDVAYPIRLLGMSVSEASQLIQDEGTKKGIKLTGDQVERLIARTGGVPLAIVWSIAQMALGHSPEHVLTRLGSQNDDISRFCFDAVVEMLRGKAEYTLLLALAYLGNNVDRETLGTTAGLPTLDRDEGLIILEKLSLVNKDNAIFSMLPLTLAYCMGELEKHPDMIAKLSVFSLSNYRRSLIALYGRPSIAVSKPLPQEALVSSRILSEEGTVYNDLQTALVRHPRILLIGPPGIGKSTALRQLALESATDESRLPIYIPLRNYADAELEIIDLIARQFRLVGITNERETAIELLRSGRAMILLDAVDEVLNTQERERLLEQVRSLCAEHPLSSWVITSRSPLNDAELQGFSVLAVEELSDTQIERFVRLWYGNDTSNATRLLSSIGEVAALGTMARNPLLLTIICSTFDEQRTLPRSSAKLLESATNIMLRKWDSAQYVHRTADAGALTATVSLRLLQEVAFQTFSEGHHLFPRSDLDRIIRQFIQGRPDVRLFDASEVLAILVSQGMLTENGGGWFSFLHVSFHEYLTASYFAENPDAPLLADHANDDRWSEVIALYQELVRDRTERATVLVFAADPVSASPRGGLRLQLDEDVRHIREKVRAAQYRDALVFDFRLAARADDLIQALNETSPQVVHFSGHGSSDGLVLVGGDGHAHLVSPAALEELFRVFRGDIRVVVLNACLSLPQAQAIAAVVGCVIGTRKEISDGAATTFGASFYRGLAFGLSVQTAFEQARVALTLEHPGEEATSQIIVGPGVDPARILMVRGKG